MTIRKYEVFSVVWRGLFEPSTAPFRHERERVLTDTTKTGFHKIISKVDTYLLSLLPLPLLLL